MSTVDHWAEYFRENPDHLMSYVVDALGCHVFRHDEVLKRVGPVLGRFSTLFEASRVVVAGRNEAMKTLPRFQASQHELAL